MVTNCCYGIQPVITTVTSCYYDTTILVLDTQFVVLAPPSNSEVKDGWVSWNSCCYGNQVTI